MSPTIVQSLRERITLESSPDGVMWVDSHGQILLVNPAMEMITGYSMDELVGQNVSIFLPAHLHDKHAESMRGYFHAPRARAMGGMDMTLLRRDGKQLPVDISLGHWVDEGERFAIAYIRDLTERKGFEESLRHRATHDDLTGLPNRWFLRSQLDQALARAKRGKRHVAALLLDLDDFKSINDSFGHATGDQLLVQVAQRLRSVLREGDTLARMGGDEFAILLSDMGEPAEAVNVAKKLLKALDSPYQLQSQYVLSGGSVGLAFYPGDTDDSESLLRFADMAMYQAKQQGRGAYACFSHQLNQSAHEKLHMHVRLKESIDRGSLMLAYQPQVDVGTGKIVGAEALLRWNDAMLGEVSPARFVPLAETTGLILPLSDWVLDAACAQIAHWDVLGVPLPVAVNFSAQQFRQGNLPERVASALKKAGANARLLKIEVTESIAMEQPDLARNQLAALMELGCSIALDDFGTGYSSLSYLKSLPVSVLKVDRSFVKDLPHGPNDAKIVKSIIALAHNLGMTLVAEGVETVEQLEFLRLNGCETYQGWYFSKALDPKELTQRMQSENVN